MSAPHNVEAGKINDRFDALKSSNDEHNVRK
jgi:hypothetical protein